MQNPKKYKFHSVSQTRQHNSTTDPAATLCPFESSLFLSRKGLRHRVIHSADLASRDFDAWKTDGLLKSSSSSNLARVRSYNAAAVSLFFSPPSDPLIDDCWKCASV